MKTYTRFLKINLLLIFLSLFFSIATLKRLLSHKNANFQRKILGEKVSFKTLVSANIGVKTRISIYGYTSPKASVYLEGIGILEQTYADDEGYFIFKNIILPENEKEVCLTAQDQFGRTTYPLCLPPIPTKTASSIGPVIMPPTLSLDKNLFFVGDRIIISGQTIPNTKVNLLFFKEKGTNLPLFIALVKPALAQEKTKSVETKADEKGNFTFALNASASQKLNIFSTTTFQNFPSPQSLKLSVKIYPLWMTVILYLKVIFTVLRSYLLEILLLIELFIVLWIVYKLLKPKTIIRTKIKRNRIKFHFK